LVSTFYLCELQRNVFSRFIRHPCLHEKKVDFMEVAMNGLLVGISRGSGMVRFSDFNCIVTYAKSCLVSLLLGSSSQTAHYISLYRGRNLPSESSSRSTILTESCTPQRGSMAFLMFFSPTNLAQSSNHIVIRWRSQAFRKEALRDMSLPDVA